MALKLRRSVSLSRRGLRWAAVLVPAAFVGGFDLMRHYFWSELGIPKVYGDAVLLLFLVVGSLVFSRMVFGTIAHLEAQVVERGRILAVLEERERIAREMHDGIAQVLGYVITTTQACVTLLDAGRTDQARRSIERLERAAHEVYADVREAILGLRSSALRSGGLLEAIREYIPRFADASDLAIDLDIDPDVHSGYFSPASEVQLLRIVQEALTNVRKHAAATRAEVRVRQEANQIVFAVSDNGRGFNPTQIAQDGRPRLGLQTMRERAEAVHGHLRIESAPGSGTTVIVSIPIGEGGDRS